MRLKKNGSLILNNFRVFHDTGWKIFVGVRQSFFECVLFNVPAVLLALSSLRTSLIRDSIVKKLGIRFLSAQTEVGNGQKVTETLFSKPIPPEKRLKHCLEILGYSKHIIRSI